jgi:hypothetical protein
MTKEQILKDIDSIYKNAVKDGKWHTAWRIKEMQGKALGLFMPQRLPNIVRIADMNDDQLTEFMERLEERDPSLKDLPPSGTSKEVEGGVAS